MEPPAPVSTAPDADISIQSTEPITQTTVPTEDSGGSGGARPGQIGIQEEGNHLFQQFDRGFEAKYTEAQKSMVDQATGQRARLDYFYDDGQVRLVHEVKAGYVSGQYYTDQAGKYLRISNQ